MAKTDTPSHDSFKAAVQAFLQERLEAKLDKLKDDDPKREEERNKYRPTVWIEDAARRVQQIQAVTHSLKPIHPDARGTNLYVEPDSLPMLTELGSHALGKDFAPDVTGNAAALDVYKFLKLQVGERSLLTALQEEDPAAMQVLHDDAAQAKALRDKLVGLTQPGSGGASSHSRAKQLYWLTGSDAAADDDYELLAPLFATSLAHRVYADVQEVRFGEANKAARQAWRERKAHDGVLVDYPGLAMQKMGGTKPQNISQLNSERGGVNYLLASLPPIWKVTERRLPVNTDSVFKHLYPQRPDVQKTVRELRRFLEEDPEPNLATRERRAAYVETLVNELLNLAGELQQGLPAGWTLNDKRFQQLAPVEQLWLDPRRATLPDEDDFAKEWLWQDWPAAIAKRFGNWLNDKLAGRLLVGDVEAREWQRALIGEDDGWREALTEQRKHIHQQRGQ
ncbi:type I-F CRISPR-associated protein Csy1 [Verminephrobacter eiseniae]|uniref:CRISPR-associated protein, Csy1 family n=1 Tax=Verminephrobacter eiseniae (strain EF01-2) TaxID=391735 RepID=A1WHW1_VEREI|nr:type I-F CRISPR-associated protein Csy1 [Verminephrobacter eiseniae]ABM57218.1 CRISPR-associated protein, Csy1 family [Verminephrobacter eiseniae EF01-2]MCW5282847.1 type I-F CRISPR-associated protein Csy1 [Verminephrobacter eiseniae]MCW5303163.1 type I-F CRISPR-associated protein Csy1 [Verminephrobacter eiseniae]MCW8179899.1 type I-F CRISPR-associated protein Csy1 [Verminephrobacter eiseniae]MCW8189299.1 type I-F CRISPR-associated protein Csy1 [Verminephrobacter eiseniae]